MIHHVKKKTLNSLIRRQPSTLIRRGENEGRETGYFIVIGLYRVMKSGTRSMPWKSEPNDLSSFFSYLWEFNQVVLSMSGFLITQVDWERVGDLYSSTN